MKLIVFPDWKCRALCHGKHLLKKMYEGKAIYANNPACSANTWRLHANSTPQSYSWFTWPHPAVITGEVTWSKPAFQMTHKNLYDVLPLTQILKRDSLHFLNSSTLLCIRATDTPLSFTTLSECLPLLISSSWNSTVKNPNYPFK